MQQSSNFILLFPSQVDWENFNALNAFEPFSEESVEFLNALSSSLLQDPLSREYSDVIAFAFFCRKGNVLRLKEKYINSEELRLGRGVAFHIAPSNVPINFAYSFVAGLLAGNNNVVRVSSKNFPQVDLVVCHIKKLSNNPLFTNLLSGTVLVKYDRASDATAFFSSFANVRMIWGGDETIKNIRQNTSPSRCVDICFADRYSVCCLNPESILVADDTELKKLAQNFYNDTYLFDQNACTAPHVIFWKKNKNIAQAKERFWNEVHAVVMKQYKLQSVVSVDKLIMLYTQAAEFGASNVPMPDNYIVRMQLKTLPKNIEDYRCVGGFFVEYDIEELREIVPIVNSKYQTLAYYGFDKESLKQFVKDNRLKGIDRITPVGGTTLFSLTWDGYNLIDMMSRIVSVD